MIIAVASGKGGTGKTTIATGLALALAGSEHTVGYLDCDVEAPNAHLFLKPIFTQSKDVNLLIPLVDDDKCTGCGICADVCAYHAIVVLGGKTLVFPELCHGCGSCTLMCPEDAITEVPQRLGLLEAGETAQGIHFAQGLLNVGEPMAVPVIHQLKKWQAPQQNDITIMDAPPGSSCPVVESLREADFVLLVTEPTPFGLHDLKSAIQVAKEVNIPAGVIINRDGIGDAQVEAFCQDAGIPILLRIPYARDIGEGIARGRSLIDIRPEYTGIFRRLLDDIAQQLAEAGEKVQ